MENHKVFEDEILLGKAIVFAVLVEEALKRLGWSRGRYVRTGCVKKCLGNIH